MTQWSHPLCGSCRHRRPLGAEVDRRPRCEAFPGGIPMAIAVSGHDHRLRFPGDAGIRFEPTAPGAGAEAVAALEAAGLAGCDLSDQAPVVRARRQRWFVVGGRQATCRPSLEALGQASGLAARMVKLTWVLDARALTVLAIEPNGVAHVLDLATGDQPAETAGWLIAEAARACIGGPPTALVVPYVTTPGQRRPAAILGDAAEDLDCDVVSLRSEVGPQAFTCLRANLRPWPASLPRH